MTQVSVIIPAYNATATLDRTLTSVRRQTHTALEIIVVDDGSTDDTPLKAQRHADEDDRIRIIRQENGGVAKARNTGIEAATNNWVALIDADDLWHPRTVARFLDAADTAPTPVTFVYTWSRRIDEDDRVFSDLGQPTYSGDIMGQLVASNFTRNASASMLDRASVLKIGGYDAGLQAAGAHGAEDIDIYLRLAALGPATVAKGYHVGYRQITGSMSANADRMRRSIDLALAKADAAQSDLNPRLFKLAQANYELYAAGLSLSGGKMGDLFRYVGRALRLSPVYALLYLALAGPYSLAIKFASGTGPKFDTLDPDQRQTLPIANLLMSVQDTTHAGLLRAPRTTPA